MACSTNPVDVTVILQSPEPNDESIHTGHPYGKLCRAVRRKSRPQGNAGWRSDHRRRCFIARRLDGEQLHLPDSNGAVLEGLFQRFDVGSAKHATLRDDARQVPVRRDVERRIAELGPFRRQAR